MLSPISALSISSLARSIGEIVGAAAKFGLEDPSLQDGIRSSFALLCGNCSLLGLCKQFNDCSLDRPNSSVPLLPIITQALCHDIVLLSTQLTANKGGEEVVPITQQKSSVPILIKKLAENLYTYDGIFLTFITYEGGSIPFICSNLVVSIDNFGQVSLKCLSAENVVVDLVWGGCGERQNHRTHLMDSQTTQKKLEFAAQEYIRMVTEREKLDSVLDVQNIIPHQSTITAPCGRNILNPGDRVP